METLPPTSPIQKAEPPYFSVSLLKLAILSVLTFGLYELYWMYQNWKLIRDRSQYVVTPFLRAFFAIICIYQLFKTIGETIEAYDPDAKNEKFHPGRLAFMWIVITLLQRLPDPWWIVSMFSFVPLLLVQSRINKLNALMAPGTVVNAKFTWANWIWIIVGGIILVLAIIGTMIPDTP